MSDWPLLNELGPVEASVPRDATFVEAARVLGESGLAAIAVLDADRRVVGLFTQDDLLGGLFGDYLNELRHTAFLEPSVDALLERARDVASRQVHEHMTEPATVEAGSSTAHLAERFLHSESGALAVTDGGVFVGMVTQLDLCRTLVRRLESPEGEDGGGRIRTSEG